MYVKSNCCCKASTRHPFLELYRNNWVTKDILQQHLKYTSVELLKFGSVWFLAEIVQTLNWTEQSVWPKLRTLNWTKHLVWGVLVWFGIPRAFLGRLGPPGELWTEPMSRFSQFPKPWTKPSVQFTAFMFECGSWTKCQHLYTSGQSRLSIIESQARKSVLKAVSEDTSISL